MDGSQSPAKRLFASRIDTFDSHGCVNITCIFMRILIDANFVAYQTAHIGN